MDPQKFNNTKRLSRDTGYVRPKKTFQDTMTPDDIKEKLKEYKKVSDIRKVIIGTHIRYFSKDKDSKANVFRLGGFFLGSNSAITALTSDGKQADFYTGFRFGFL